MTETLGLSIEQLRKMLKLATESARVESANKAALPKFAFLLMKEDAGLVFWCESAVDYDSARAAAIASVEKIFTDSIGNVACMIRPLPGPRGRKALATVIEEKQ